MQQAAAEQNWVFDVTAEDFDARVVQADVPVVVDFWAEWCGPCRQISPILDSLAGQYAGRLNVAKVNVDEEGALAQAFGVRSIPYLVVFHGGQPVEQLVGVQPEAELKRVLDRYVQDAATGAGTGVQDALLAGDYETALPLLEQAHAAEPDNAGTAADLARCLFLLGRTGDAEQLLGGLPADVSGAPEIEQIRSEIAVARAADGLRDRATLERLLADAPDDLEVLHELARVTAAARDFDAALAHFFTLMAADRGFADDAGRRGLIDLFEVLGSGDGRVRDYRRRMSSLLN